MTQYLYHIRTSLEIQYTNTFHFLLKQLQKFTHGNKKTLYDAKQVKLNKIFNLTWLCVMSNYPPKIICLSNFFNTCNRIDQFPI